MLCLLVILFMKVLYHDVIADCHPVTLPALYLCVGFLTLIDISSYVTCCTAAIHDIMHLSHSLHPCSHLVIKASSFLVKLHTLWPVTLGLRTHLLWCQWVWRLCVPLHSVYVTLRFKAVCTQFDRVWPLTQVSGYSNVTMDVRSECSLYPSLTWHDLPCFHVISVLIDVRHSLILAKVVHSVIKSTVYCLSGVQQPPGSVHTSSNYAVQWPWLWVACGN